MISLVNFPSQCCRCNAAPGTGRLSISDSSVGRIRSVGVPVCPACIEAIGTEGKARAATIRRTLLRVMLWVWLGSGPFAALGLLLYFVLRADVILWVFVAIPGLLSAGVMLGLPLHLLFSPVWGRHWAVTKTARFEGEGILFGNAGYQLEFDRLNRPQSH